MLQRGTRYLCYSEDKGNKISDTDRLWSGAQIGRTRTADCRSSLRLLFARALRRLVYLVSVEEVLPDRVGGHGDGGEWVEVALR